MKMANQLFAVRRINYRPIVRAKIQHAKIFFAGIFDGFIKAFVRLVTGSGMIVDLTATRDLRMVVQNVC